MKHGTQIFIKDVSPRSEMANGGSMKVVLSPLSYSRWRHFRKLPKRGVTSFTLAPYKQNMENEI